MYKKYVKADSKGTKVIWDLTTDLIESINTSMQYLRELDYPVIEHANEETRSSTISVLTDVDTSLYNLLDRLNIRRY